MTHLHSDQVAEQEKNSVALSSVLAAVFITIFKIIVGLFTHSLGILAEAAHSALDLVAAAVTFFAVRISGKAPDARQMFGYGKVENLSALFETFLLLLTCVWIIYEAIQRLFFQHVKVEVSIWSFVVMLTSIIVDVSRSRALMKAAKKHGSQALEADALHFSTDVWSSSVVIIGLLLVALGEYLASRALLPASLLDWFHRADAIAALGVSLIVIWVSVELGKRTIEGLLDSAPAGLSDKIKEGVSRIPGISQVRQIRIRPSGPSTFVDMILDIPRTTNFEEAHEISVAAKKIVTDLVERSDVMIHLDPVSADESSLLERVASIVGRSGLSAHSIVLNDGVIGQNLDMHIEVPETDTLDEAHARADKLESQLRHEIPNLGEVFLHLEPRGEAVIRKAGETVDCERCRECVSELPSCFPGVNNCHSLYTYRSGEKMTLSFHCDLPASMPIAEAHELTRKMEEHLRRQVPELERVSIHTEPR